MLQFRLTGVSTAAPLAVERDLDHGGATGGRSMAEKCIHDVQLV